MCVKKERDNMKITIVMNSDKLEQLSETQWERKTCLSLSYVERDTLSK